ncbi:tetratricopeptide repeat protein [Janthinobacterium sp. SUN118]|uniref:tetratricopeptide repeat protein n=1 Tax=Janthinobacterium sp. SUN118 TaxID=3004100 RepID=UPI0025AFAC45|nr:tetratricopeptide repeat protein [Janthinobacterium sp. SUN118]MDN2710313.1 tetratricopeptide repeat protein [Janthinobacterium sp. SUN118]
MTSPGSTHQPPDDARKSATPAMAPLLDGAPQAGHQDDAPRARFAHDMAAYAAQHRITPWRGQFADFLEQILPTGATLLARNAHQYLWDMMRWNGQTDGGGRFRCRLFDDELFGIDEAIDRVAAYFKAAAAGSEVGRRMLLLLGPPSGGKSTMVILLKRGLEEYSHSSEGALYGIDGCPVHESPLHLVPHGMRADFRASYGVELQGELCPHCRARLEEQYAGDFLRMPVERIHISEAGRCGIGTYAPHDPTTADLADLVGSVDLSKVAQYGDEGDPRAWSWSGAVYAASRGMLEMIEILKVKREFLYTLEHFPNHHRALASMAKLGLRQKSAQPGGARYTVSCFFERAIAYAPHDVTARMVYGNYLLATGQDTAALEQLDAASRLAPEQATIQYNLGLMYVKKKEYEKAGVHAHKAYALGFPLPGLKNKLKAAGKWREAPPAPPATEAASVPDAVAPPASAAEPAVAPVEETVPAPPSGA